MTRASIVVVGFFLLEACTVSGPPRSPLSDAELLAGDPFPWHASELPPVASSEQAFGLDDDMQAFVKPLAIGDATSRLNRLLGGMRDHGLFDVAYTDAFTRSASGTFHDRKGNCLSYTMLFIALARAAGLDARFQVVEVPPSWNNDNGLSSSGCT